ncbi:MAG: hypothetical protein U9P14_07765 [Gemmatimonadota bacterium]|nr:hypothetical protein [Gemmatimonadota bacterium]
MKETAADVEVTGDVPGKGAKPSLVLFFIYVAILALAAVSEVFSLGWFDYPVFK